MIIKLLQLVLQNLLLIRYFPDFDNNLVHQLVAQLKSLHASISPLFPFNAAT